MDTGGTIMYLKTKCIKNIRTHYSTDVNLFPKNDVCDNDCLSCEYYDCIIQYFAKNNKKRIKKTIDKCTIFSLTHFTTEEEDI